MRGAIIAAVLLGCGCVSGVEPDPSRCTIQVDSTGVVVVPDSVLAHCLTAPAAN